MSTTNIHVISGFRQDVDDIAFLRDFTRRRVVEDYHTTPPNIPEERRSQHKYTQISSCTISRYFCLILNKFGFYRQIFMNVTDSKFRENPVLWGAALMHADGHHESDKALFATMTRRLKTTGGRNDRK
jgi:hypothetical protein